MRATLVFLRKLTSTPGDIVAADVDTVRAAGVSENAIRDAITVCAAFNIIDRIADALDFRVPTRAEFDQGAQIIYEAGYAMFG